jgi:aryl-alcohol dehydrogenase-like predicted oxidoreductase
LRQGAGLTTLQTIFDKLDYTQRLYGKIRLQAIRKNFSKGKIRNILGHDPDERFFTSHSQKYEVAVEEGNYSTSQRQMELQQLLHFRELGIPIANKSIVRAAFITNKAQVQQEMEEEVKQQMDAQQAQSQQQEKMDNSKIMAAVAKSRSDLAREKDLMASAQEKMAKITEIQASAEHKRSQADLDMVKTMIELEDMDLQNFKNNLELAEYIKMQREKDQLQQQPAIAG